GVPLPGPSAAPARAPARAARAAADVEASFMNVRRVPFRPMVESSIALVASCAVIKPAISQSAYPNLGRAVGSRQGGPILLTCRLLFWGDARDNRRGPLAYAGWRTSHR